MADHPRVQPSTASTTTYTRNATREAPNKPSVHRIPADPQTTHAADPLPTSSEPNIARRGQRAWNAGEQLSRLENR